MERRLRLKRPVLLVIGIAALLLAAAYPRGGEASHVNATAPTLGTAASFAVLGGSTVTNTGETIVTGNVGVWPGSAVTGFPPGRVFGGTIHRGDAVAQQAQNDATTAYNSLAGQPCDEDLTGQDLGGLTLTTGTYCFSTSAQLTGTLTLDAQGNPDAVFIFQIGTTLTTASDSTVRMINGGNPCNVYWQIGSSATLGTGTHFEGNILALASTTLTTHVGVVGRALASTGAVTMDSNTVSIGGCSGVTLPTATATSVTPPTSTPIPATATAIPPTTTPVPATATAIAATATAAAAPTGTAIAATATAIAAPTGTAIAATATAIAAPTNTAIAATATAIAAPTATAIAATATAVAAATNTAVASPTSTPIAVATATPKPHARATPTSTATATATAVALRATSIPTPGESPKTGGGGTYRGPTAGGTGNNAPIPSSVGSGASSPTALPRTGGGADGGNDPLSPLIPLAVLGLVGLCTGRFMRKRSKRA